VTESFSKRHGFHQPPQTEITVRHGAPAELRGVIVQLAYEHGFDPKELRSLVCKVLRKRPDPNNWAAYPNIDEEIHRLIDDCEWYRVYDVIESIAVHMRQNFPYNPEKFESELNDYFVENGIGWKVIDGKIEVRGSETFEETVRSAEVLLDTKGLGTARKELHEALEDLSRRPAPDITGAIQHSMAALECVARQACGNEKANLGDIMKQYRDIIPRPLDEVVSKAWGFASENARHLREGREPNFEEAELIVGIVSCVAMYLSRKHEV
jgi:AbiJ N-terminal domain 4